MDAASRYYAEYNIAQEKGIEIMKAWLDERGYGYSEKDNRFNETMLEVFDDQDNKVGEARIVSLRPQISIWTGETIEYQAGPIEVTEQEINDYYVNSKV